MRELDRRFQRTVAEALAVPGTREPPFPLRLPPALESTLRALDAGEAAEAFYCDRMPRKLVDQMLRGGDRARALLWLPLRLDRLPRLSAGLRALCELLPSARGWIEGRRTVAELAAGTLLGSGLPMVGAWPHDLERMEDELREGDPEEVLDLRLSAGVVHELCHGPSREATGPPVPWMVLEACALWLSMQAFPRHVFPDEPGEALPGVALFVLFGQCLARIFGPVAVARLSVGEIGLEEAVGEPAARALRERERRDFQARGEVPFAPDALSVLDWVRLVAGGWRQEPAAPADLEIARTAVRALFQANVLIQGFETRPLAEIRGVALDVGQGLIERERAPSGVFGEPAFWIWPPPLCRGLAERGVRRIVVEAVPRRRMRGLAEALIELSLERGPLPAEIRWTSSPA